EHYDRKTGKVSVVERDTDHDKKTDVWEEYDDSGGLVAVRMDRNGDGKPDVWEQYDRGLLTAILYDDDFDNRVDRKETRKNETPTPPPSTSEGTPGAKNVKSGGRSTTSAPTGQATKPPETAPPAPEGIDPSEAPTAEPTAGDGKDAKAAGKDK